MQNYVSGETYFNIRYTPKRSIIVKFGNNLTTIDLIEKNLKTRISLSAHNFKKINKMKINDYFIVYSSNGKGKQKDKLLLELTDIYGINDTKVLNRSGREGWNIDTVRKITKNNMKTGDDAGCIEFKFITKIQ